MSTRAGSLIIPGGSALKPKDPEPAPGQVWKVANEPSGARISDYLRFGNEFEIQRVTERTIYAKFLSDGQEHTLTPRYFVGPSHKYYAFVRMAGPVKPPIDMSRYPSECPRCRSRAYVGGGPLDIECTGQDCQFSIHPGS